VEVHMNTAISTCFAHDYVNARENFRTAATHAGGTLRGYSNPHRGPRGEALATDTAWIGDLDAARVLVLISATHGVEGFTGSAAQVDWLRNGGPATLPPDTAALLIHAINPHGFAWLRRVTEEGVDLNRNFVDFAQTLPANPGYDELADALVPAELSGPVFEAAEARIQAYRDKHGERLFQIARGGGQYRHPGGLFYGGTGPTWSRLTTEAIVADYKLATRRAVAGIDFHTALGPFGYGEPICGHDPGSPGAERAQAWYGDSVTQPALGTSSSVPKVGLSQQGWERMLGDRVTFITLEFGTYSTERGRRALREDHWLHNRGPFDWDDAEVRRIKRQIRKHFYPDSDDWKEMILWRSQQIVRQATAGLARVK
jgi:hypothetical protein